MLSSLKTEEGYKVDMDNVQIVKKQGGDIETAVSILLSHNHILLLKRRARSDDPWSGDIVWGLTFRIYDSLKNMLYESLLKIPPEGNCPVCKLLVPHDLWWC